MMVEKTVTDETISIVGSLTPTEKQNRYNILIEDIRTTFNQRMYNKMLEEIAMRHDVGESIVTSGLYHKNAYGQKLVPNLARDLGINERILHYNIRLYYKAEEAGGLAELIRDIPQESLTWTIVRNLIAKTPVPPDIPDMPDMPIIEKTKAMNEAVKKALRYARNKIGQEWTEHDVDELAFVLRREPVGKWNPKTEIVD